MLLDSSFVMRPFIATFLGSLFLLTASAASAAPPASASLAAAHPSATSGAKLGASAFRAPAPRAARAGSATAARPKPDAAPVQVKSSIRPVATIQKDIAERTADVDRHTSLIAKLRPEVREAEDKVAAAKAALVKAQRNLAGTRVTISRARGAARAAGAERLEDARSQVASATSELVQAQDDLGAKRVQLTTVEADLRGAQSAALTAQNELAESRMGGTEATLRALLE